MKKLVWKLERRLINSDKIIVSYHRDYHDMGEYINVSFATLKQIYYKLRSNILTIEDCLYKITITKQKAEDLSPAIYFSIFNVEKPNNKEKVNRLIARRRKYDEEIEKLNEQNQSNNLTQ